MRIYGGVTTGKPYGPNSNFGDSGILVVDDKGSHRDATSI
jgi:hypothetical protein